MLLCPKSDYVLVCRSDPALVIPAGCKAYRCDVCGPAKVRERVRLMAFGVQLAWPGRFVRLSLLPPNWQKARMQLRDFARRVRKAYQWEWAWSIEENPLKTGYHLHAIQWGEYVPKARLEELWGGRFIDIGYLEKEGAENYVTKCYDVAKYSNKVAIEHLDLNGGRAVHMSRGYLHGMTAREALKEMSSGKKWFLRLAKEKEGSVRQANADIDQGRLINLFEERPGKNEDQKERNAEYRASVSDLWRHGPISARGGVGMPILPGAVQGVCGEGEIEADAA